MTGGGAGQFLVEVLKARSEFSSLIHIIPLNSTHVSTLFHLFSIYLPTFQKCASQFCWVHILVTFHRLIMFQLNVIATQLPLKVSPLARFLGGLGHLRWIPSVNPTRQIWCNIFHRAIHPYCIYIYTIIIYYILIGGFKHFFDVPFSYMGWYNPSHWRSYFSEGLTPPTSIYVYIYIIAGLTIYSIVMINHIFNRINHIYIYIYISPIYPLYILASGPGRSVPPGTLRGFGHRHPEFGLGPLGPGGSWSTGDPGVPWFMESFNILYIHIYIYIDR